jgi:hypothetical protein
MLRPASTLLLAALAACGGGGGDDVQSLGADLTGNPAAIDVGFNGGPDQFDYFPDFYGASTVHPGPRLCHTYVVWNVAEQPRGMGDASSPPGSRAWFEYWLHQAQGR